MKRRVFSILVYIILSGFILFLAILLFPRKYEVLKFEERSGTRYWELNTGSRIGYQKLEKDSIQKSNPIIYLHGGPGGMITDATIDLLKPLSEKHDLYLYDQLGSGHSKRVKDIKEYTVERHRKDLEAIVQNINAEQVILIGQSWGTMLAMEYLTHHPDKVEKLILTGPGPILPINSSLSKVKKPDSLDLKTPKYSNKEGNQKAYNLRSKFLHYCARTFGKKLSSDEEADDFFTYLNNELMKSTECDPEETKESSGGGGFYTHVMTIKSFNKVEDRKDLIKELKTPVLIIKGQCDNQKWGFTSEYLELLPHSELHIFEGAGHVIGKEHQEKYIKTVSDFLN